MKILSLKDGKVEEGPIYTEAGILYLIEPIREKIKLFFNYEIKDQTHARIGKRLFYRKPSITLKQGAKPIR